VTATVTLSIEIELGWGRIDEPGPHPALSEGRRAETRALDRLLAVCDEHHVPITFDVVGHLLHRECDGHHDGPHPAGWFAKDPGTDVESDPQFYAPDLVEMIRDADVDHEIATHTYSHVLCEEVPERVVAWELDRVTDLHRSIGLDPPRSFVPPRHEKPPAEVVRKRGIEAIRTPFPGSDPPVGGRPGTFVWMLSRSHPAGTTGRAAGITTTYVTPYPSLTPGYLPSGRRQPHPVFRLVPERLRRGVHLRHLRQALGRTVASDGQLHLWTHLYNLANEAQWRPIRAFLSDIGEQREAGVSRLVRMGDLLPTPATGVEP